MPETPRLMRIVDWSTSYENNRTRELKRMDYILVPNRMDTDGYTRGRVCSRRARPRLDSRAGQGVAFVFRDPTND